MENDFRGPIRKITGVEETSSATLLTLDCGHTGSHAPHFSYSVGDDVHCFFCGPADRQMAGAGLRDNNGRSVEAE